MAGQGRSYLIDQHRNSKTEDSYQEGCEADTSETVLGFWFKDHISSNRASINRMNSMHAHRAQMCKMQGPESRVEL